MDHISSENEILENLKILSCITMDMEIIYNKFNFCGTFPLTEGHKISIKR